MARITFIGAAGVVTGSKHLLETDTGARVLLDCGLYQGLRELTERNWTPPPVDPKHLDAVLLSHGHLDHCGYLPALVQQGFHAPIYCTSATADVTELVLRDAAGLQEDEAVRARKHPDRGLHQTPLYTHGDVDKVVPLAHSATAMQATSSAQRSWRSGSKRTRSSLAAISVATVDRCCVTPHQLPRETTCCVSRRTATASTRRTIPKTTYVR
jgi:Cft2 family RNA processing exonuclease